jgi:hypothetical protein
MSSGLSIGEATLRGFAALHSAYRFTSLPTAITGPVG